MWDVYFVLHSCHVQAFVRIQAYILHLCINQILCGTRGDVTNRVPSVGNYLFEMPKTTLMLPKIDIILPQPYDTISQIVEIRQMEPWMQIITAIYNHMTTKRKTDHSWLTGFKPSTPQSREDPGPHGQPIRKEKAD